MMSRTQHFLDCSCQNCVNELLENIEPVIYGGGMISEVTLNSAVWADIPWRFEAGTPDYVGVIAFSHAIEYLEKIGIENVRKHESELTEYAMERLKKLNNFTKTLVRFDTTRYL